MTIVCFLQGLSIFPILIGSTSSSTSHPPGVEPLFSANLSGYSIRQHPALQALAQQAPRDRAGQLITLPKLNWDSLTDPLSGRCALLSADGSAFTIIPRASLLVNPEASPPGSVLFHHLPHGLFQAISPFLQAEKNHFTPISLTLNQQGIYSLNQQDEALLRAQNPGRSLIFLDTRSHLPINQIKRELSSEPLSENKP